MRRNNRLSFRKPETLSVGRAAGMNQTVVNKWFEEFEKVIDDNGPRNLPSHVWNCDESGLQDNFQTQKAVAATGKPCFQISK